MHSRSVEVSMRSRSGKCSRAWNIVGTPAKIVTPSRSMVSRTPPGSKRGIIVRQAPTRTPALSITVCPNEWKSGRAPSVTSSSESFGTDPTCSHERRRLSWVMIAPFGVPVVPDV